MMTKAELLKLSGNELRVELAKLNEKQKISLYSHACRHGYEEAAIALVDEYGVPVTAAMPSNKHIQILIETIDKGNLSLAMRLIERLAENPENRARLSLYSDRFVRWTHTGADYLKRLSRLGADHALFSHAILNACSTSGNVEALSYVMDQVWPMTEPVPIPGEGGAPRLPMMTGFISGALRAGQEKVAVELIRRFKEFKEFCDARNVSLESRLNVNDVHILYKMLHSKSYVMSWPSCKTRYDMSREARAEEVSRTVSCLLTNLREHGLKILGLSLEFLQDVIKMTPVGAHAIFSELIKCSAPSSFFSGDSSVTLIYTSNIFAKDQRNELMDLIAGDKSRAEAFIGSEVLRRFLDRNFVAANPESESTLEAITALCDRRLLGEEHFKGAATTLISSKFSDDNAQQILVKLMDYMAQNDIAVQSHPLLLREMAKKLNSDSIERHPDIIKRVEEKLLASQNSLLILLPEQCEALLEAGLSVHARNAEGVRLSHFSSLALSPRAALQLIDKGLLIFMEDESGVTPFSQFVSAAYRHDRLGEPDSLLLIQRFLDEGVSPDCACTGRSTDSGKVETVRSILNQVGPARALLESHTLRTTLAEEDQCVADASHVFSTRRSSGML